MIHDDYRHNVISELSLEGSKIDLSTPIIFVCGGKVNVKEFSSPSVRDGLLRYLAHKSHPFFDQFVIAEHFKDWINDSIYKDLLVFEDDIAHISSLIILILESPGSLTELGLFVRNLALKSKLLIFISEEHYNQESFIRLGPLRYLSPNTDDENTCVFSYPWEHGKIDESLKDYFPHMQENIDGFLQKKDKTEKFSEKNNGHVALLIYELISIFRALKLKEIQEFIGKLGIHINQEKTKRLLFLLRKFEFIDCTMRGNIDYYFPKKSDSKIKFPGRIDKTSIKLEVYEYYKKNSHESIRMKVIAEKLGSK